MRALKGPSPFLVYGLVATLFAGFWKLVILLTIQISGYTPITYSWWWVILPVAGGWLLEVLCDIKVSIYYDRKDENMDREEKRQKG